MRVEQVRGTAPRERGRQEPNPDRMALKAYKALQALMAYKAFRAWAAMDTRPRFDSLRSDSKAPDMCL